MAASSSGGACGGCADEFDVLGIGLCKVTPNSDQGYEKTFDREDSGLIIMPERLIFTKENVASFNF